MTASVPRIPAVRGLTLAELAARHSLSEHEMGELLRPLVESGVVAVHGSQVMVEDGAVIAAFARGERAT